MAKDQRRYTDREKAEALAIVDMQDGSVRKASQLTGIPDSTLFDWIAGKRVNGDVADLHETAKTRMAGLFDSVIVATLENMLIDGSMQRANFQQKAIAVGILYDKRALLLGQPTSINENLMSDEARVERLAALLEQARQRQLTGQPVSDTIAGHLSKSDDPGSTPAPASYPLSG